MLIGEIGGLAEQQAAEYIASEMRKPVIAFIAGRDGAAGTADGPRGRDHRRRRRYVPPSANFEEILLT